MAAGWSPDGSKSEMTSNFPVWGVMSVRTRMPSRYEVGPTTWAAEGVRSHSRGGSVNARDGYEESATGRLTGWSGVTDPS